MNEPNLSRIPSVSAFLKRFATLFKLAGMAMLILLLLIPLGMIRSVLGERLERRNEAVAGITSGWGKEQNIIGPVLIVPYRYSIKSWKEQPVAGGKSEKVELVKSGRVNCPEKSSFPVYTTA